MPLLSKITLQLIDNLELSRNNYPAQIIAVEWLNDKNESLATVFAKHDYKFQSYDNDREYSHFLEQVSWLENDMLSELKKIYPDIYEKIKICGRLVITNEKSEIVYYQKK